MGNDIDWCLARQVWFVLLLSWCGVERIKYSYLDQCVLRVRLGVGLSRGPILNAKPHSDWRVAFLLCALS